MTDYLYIWTIYDHPRDMPDYWVVRQWRVGDGGKLQTCLVVHGYQTLEEAQDSIPPGLCWFPRQNEDDPCIVESWLL